MIKDITNLCRHLVRKRSLTLHWPNFVIIGAQKCGTTSLYNYLIQHPGILSAQWKEVHYYDLYYNKGPYWYCAWFPRLSSTNGMQITGEASPYYLFHPQVPKRMVLDMPKVKIIVMLRNPADRAFSHYLHGMRWGYETRSFEEALLDEPNCLKGEEDRLIREPFYYSEKHRHFSYLTRGLYADQLVRWFQYFPRDQFLFIKSEDVFKRPQEEYQKVLRFLGMPEWTLPDYGKLNASNGEQMDPVIREKLMNHFSDHNRRLQGLTGIDFGWQ